MTTCTEHPDYRGIAAPTGDCPACWAIYSEAHPSPAASASTPTEPAAGSFGEFMSKQDQADQAKRVERLVDDLRIARAALQGAVKRAIDAERLRESVFGLKDTPLEPPQWLLERSTAGDAPHVACLLASDFQFGEVIDGGNMDGINEYNVDVAEDRYRRLIERTVDIAFEHLPRNRYSGVNYLRLGDMVSGDIHQELRETNELSGVTSLPRLVALETWGVRALASAFGRVHVVSVPGNHGRTTLKPPTKRVEENYDWLSACWLESNMRGDGRVTWQTPRSTDAVFPMFDRLYLATHGDNIGTRGGQGFVGPGAPILRGATQTLGEYARRGIHVDKMMIGHFHTAFDFGRGWSNGSLPGYSEFARSCRMVPEPPQQWLLFFHPKHGATSAWKVQVSR